MDKYLLVGDPHAEPSTLDDCRKLLGYVRKIAMEQNARIVLLGDIHHTHGVVYAEVQWMWWSWLKHLQWPDRQQKPILVRGNHDGPVSGHIHSLVAYEEYTQLVATKSWIDPDTGWVFIPHYRDNDAFVAEAANYPDATIVCHATFDGSRYENGFYAKDGIDPNLIHAQRIISGHIHTPQEFGKVWYPGAPRWRIQTDANVDRAVWLVEASKSSIDMKRTPYSTNHVCKRILHFADHPDMPIDVAILKRSQEECEADVLVDVKGPAEWVDQRLPELAIKGVRVRTFRDQVVQPVVSESKGIDVSFRTFVDQYVPQFGTPPEVLKSELEKRLLHV